MVPSLAPRPYTRAQLSLCFSCFSENSSETHSQPTTPFVPSDDDSGTFKINDLSLSSFLVFDSATNHGHLTICVGHCLSETKERISIAIKTADHNSVPSLPSNKELGLPDISSSGSFRRSQRRHSGGFCWDQRRFVMLNCHSHDR